MSYTIKPLEELDVIDDFLMNAVAADPEVGEPFCRAVLSVLLQRKIGKIRIVAQRTLPALTPDLKGIRMDVEIEEERETKEALPALNVYDLEPHLRDNLNLPKHNRFYQSKIDSRYLKSGETDFSKLPNLYVLTITNFDPFGYDYMMYTVQNQCLEVHEMKYEDGLQFIYFYPDGKKGGSPEIQAMLKYLQNSIAENATNAILKEVHRYVNGVKILPEVKLEYMKFEELIQYERQDAAHLMQVQSILELLEDYGPMPEFLHTRLMEEKNAARLKKWHILAAKSESLQDFLTKMED